MRSPRGDCRPNLARASPKACPILSAGPTPLGSALSPQRMAYQATGSGRNSHETPRWKGCTNVGAPVTPHEHTAYDVSYSGLGIMVLFTRIRRAGRTSAHYTLHACMTIQAVLALWYSTRVFGEPDGRAHISHENKGRAHAQRVPGVAVLDKSTRRAWRMSTHWLRMDGSGRRRPIPGVTVLQVSIWRALEWSTA